MGGNSEEAIRKRAYHIWEREGRPQGRDFEHWVQAQVELTAEDVGNGGGNGAASKKRSAAGGKPRATVPKAAAAAKPERSAAPRSSRSRKA